MRIQDTDRILKEARVARHSHVEQPPEHQGMVSRLWSSVSSLPNLITGIFKRNR